MSTILLSSDEPVLGEGLARILCGETGLEICSCSSRLKDLPGQIELHRPDVLLLDLTAEVNFSFISHIQEISSSRSKIVLWVHSISAELALQAMNLGIRGILYKSVPVETLIRCLTRVSEGEMWFDKVLTDSLLTTRRYSLTPRESQLVTLLSQGLKNKEIATVLHIAEGTVKVYLSKLFQKLGMKDRFELALFGLKNLTHGAGSHHADGAPVRSPRSFFVEPFLPPRAQERSAVLANLRLN